MVLMVTATVLHGIHGSYTSKPPPPPPLPLPVLFFMRALGLPQLPFSPAPTHPPLTLCCVCLISLTNIRGVTG